MASKTKQLEQFLSDPEPKSRVIRFNAERDDEPVRNIYVSKAHLKELGDPNRLRITIEPA